MKAINPYLTFNGNTEEAFNFYKSAFGGEFAMVMRYKDAPAEHQMGETDGNKIMHIALPIGQGTVLMGSDSPGMYGKVTMDTNFQIAVSAESEEEADKLFQGLSAGGKVTMPMEKTFWGDYFGMFTDKYDVQWNVGFDYNQKK
jgi:PhnB protein